MGCGASSPESAKVSPETGAQVKSQPLAENVKVPVAVPVVKQAQVQPKAEAQAVEPEVPVTMVKVRSVSVAPAQATGETPRTATSVAPEDLDPETVLDMLMDGNRRFLAGTSLHPHQDFKRIMEISSGQKPIAAILGCADSRVPAEIVFDQGFGDVFVCRVAGNIATAEEVASLEYAVLDLGVKCIMILGHTMCGAVKAAMSGKSFPGFIDTLVDQLDVAVERSRQSYCATLKQSQDDALAERVNHIVRENVLYQLERAKRSAVIQKAINAGTLALAGGVYHLKTGVVEIVYGGRED